MKEVRFFWLDIHDQARMEKTLGELLNDGWEIAGSVSHSDQVPIGTNMQLVGFLILVREKPKTARAL
ncbi:MAG: hypothetical protein L0346_34360 [Chloroflexi bacterium]|nr:hypothetical protein [Chloroflexota bacterium]